MKSIKIFCSSLLLLMAVAAGTGYAQEFVELKQANSGKIVLKFMFRNGSIADPVGKEGLTYLTADIMMDGSTEKYTATEIQKMIFPWAARMNCFTDKEVSTFSFEVPSDYYNDFYAIILQKLLHPAFAEEDFQRTLSNQKNFVDEVIRQSSDEEYGKKLLEAMIFRGTPYEHLTQGTSASLATITREDVMAQYRKAFTRNNLIIGIAGDYSNDMIVNLTKDFSVLPQEPAPIPELTKAEAPAGIYVDIVSKDGAIGTAISAGFPMDITRQSPDFAALMVANSWLGEHRKSYSRLYQKIREQRSMNYGDYSYIEWYENGGSNMLPVPGTPRHMNYFSIWLRPVQTAKSLKSQYPGLDSLKEGHARFALRMALREYSNLVSQGLTNEQFEETRNFLLSYTKLYVENTNKKLGFMMDSKFYGRTDWITELGRELTRLKLEDVNAAIKKYFILGKMDIVMVTDKSEVDGLKAGLESGSISPMVYSPAMQSSVTEEIKADDKEVSTFPIPVVQVRIIESDNTFSNKK